MKKKKKVSDAQTKAGAKYDAVHARRFSIKLIDISDSDIIDKLDSVDNKQGYIKAAIRAYMAAGN